MEDEGFNNEAFGAHSRSFSTRSATLRASSRDSHARLSSGWLAFTGRVSNPLDHYERFPITWSSPFPVILTLPSSFSGLCLTPTQFDCKKAACCAIMGCGGREVVYYSGFHQCLLCAVG